MSARTHRIRVPPEAEGARLDRFLHERWPEHSRAFFQRLIRAGKVRLAGRSVAKAATSLRAGDELAVEIPPPPPATLQGEPIPIDIVYEDAHLLVVSKPPGMVVHPAPGVRSGTLVHALLGRGTPLARTGAPERPGIVHRLDRETSGLLVVAKTEAAYQGLVRAFRERRVLKRYDALVWGQPDPPAGIVEHPIGRSARDRTRMSVRSPRGRPARTRYTTVERLHGLAFLEVEIETGRTHQIRVHLHALGHPVVGDRRYGGRPWREVADGGRRALLRDFPHLALHARELAFAHPVTGRPLHVEAERPETFDRLLRALREMS